MFSSLSKVKRRDLDARVAKRLGKTDKLRLVSDDRSTVVLILALTRCALCHIDNTFGLLVV